MSSLAAEQSGTFVSIPLEGISGDEPLEFPLYLQNRAGRPVLYRDVRTPFDASHAARLRAEGVTHLWVHEHDKRGYARRVEAGLEDLLHDRSVPAEERAEVLHGVALVVAQDVLGKPPGRDEVRRVERFLVSTATLVVREPGAFHAIRQLLRAGQDLADHSTTVAFLSLGLARQVVGAEPNTLVQASLAGFLHDVGLVGRPLTEDDTDTQHAERGYRFLREQGLPEPVCEAAWAHHERHDGSGLPRGLVGESIPLLGRIVGLVDAFEKVYSGQKTRMGVFDALRVLAQAYRGCFDEDLAVSLLRVFR